MLTLSPSARLVSRYHVVYQEKLQHLNVKGVFDNIISAVTIMGKAPGVLIPTVGPHRKWKSRGARCNMVAIEAQLTPTVRSFLKTVRET